jgi:transposase-like protein
MAEILVHATNIIERPTLTVGVILQKQVTAQAWLRTLRRVLDDFPALSQSRWIFSDHDAGLTAALAVLLPHIHHILDYNHFFINIKYALKKRNLASYWEQVRDDLRAFMDCETRQEYEALWAQRSQFWPQQFREYYKLHKHTQVRVFFFFFSLNFPPNCFIFIDAGATLARLSS